MTTEAVGQALLKALIQETSDQGVTALESEAVNRLGASLLLSPPETFDVVSKLESEGWVETHWGGRVAVTPSGQEHILGKSAAVQNIHLGDGAIYIGEKVHISSGVAVGAQAIAVNIQVDELLQDLRSLRSKLDPHGERLVQELVDEVTAIKKELQQPIPEKPTLWNRIGKAKALIRDLASIGQSVEVLGPVVIKAGKWLAHLSTLLG